jgi:tetratricopeptide (TPR) repeat protein
MYRKAIALKPDAFPPYLNFANELYTILYPLEKNERILDSSILLYREAIAMEPSAVNLYIALLPALADKGDTVEELINEQKILEMAPQYYVGYLQIAAIRQKQQKFNEAAGYFALAKEHCGGDSSCPLLIDELRQLSNDSTKASN